LPFSEIHMNSLLVSTKGRIVLPAELRRRLGMGAGTRLEVVEEADGIKLRLLRAVPSSDVSSLAGLVKAPSRGVPLSLDDFDPADLAAAEWAAPADDSLAP
jgi:AbrB family looped-hinge helix DNA binding protein